MAHHSHTVVRLVCPIWTPLGRLTMKARSSRNLYLWRKSEDSERIRIALDELRRVRTAVQEAIDKMKGRKDRNSPGCEAMTSMYCLPAIPLAQFPRADDEELRVVFREGTASGSYLNVERGRQSDRQHYGHSGPESVRVNPKERVWLVEALTQALAEMRKASGR